MSEPLIIPEKVIGTVIDYSRVGVVPHRSFPKIHFAHRWTIHPDKPSTKSVVFTGWSLRVLTFGKLPAYGHRIELRLSTTKREDQFGFSSKFRVLSDPLDDLQAGRSNPLAEIADRGHPRRLILSVPVGTIAQGTRWASEPEVVLAPGTWGLDQYGGIASFEIYRSIYGIAPWLDSGRLEALGIYCVEIGQARVDLDHNLHCPYGTVLPGKFYWHGKPVEWDVGRVDAVTGLFLEAADEIRFTGYMSRTMKQ